MINADELILVFKGIDERLTRLTEASLQMNKGLRMQNQCLQVICGHMGKLADKINKEENER